MARGEYIQQSNRPALGGLGMGSVSIPGAANQPAYSAPHGWAWLSPFGGFEGGLLCVTRLRRGLTSKLGSGEVGTFHY